MKVRARRYYSSPAFGSYWTWEPLNRLNDFFLKHVGLFNFTPARNLQRYDITPNKRITTLQVPPPFRDIKLPGGVKCLGTIVEKASKDYTVVYEIPRSESAAYLKAMEWALEDAGFASHKPEMTSSFHKQYQLPNQPEYDVYYNLHSDETRAFITVQVWFRPRDYVDESENLDLPPRLTLPAGAYCIGEMRSDGMLSLWPPELTSERLLAHWQGEAEAQGWQVNRSSAAWGGMLQFEKDGHQSFLSLQTENEIGWLVKLPVTGHKQWDQERRSGLKSAFKSLEKLAAERQASGH